MPSPFPGMDPYLEGSEWVSVHAELSSEIARQLAPKLRPKYIARTIRRFVTETPDDIAIATSDIYPDVMVSRTAAEGNAGRRLRLAVTPPLQLATVMPVRVPARSRSRSAMWRGASLSLLSRSCRRPISVARAIASISTSASASC